MPHSQQEGQAYQPMTNYWMMKTEPGEFSYQDLERDGWTHWDGVRNHQAKKNLMGMRTGDLTLIYHSVSTKAIVGVGKITKEAYPDPTDEKWMAVRVEPVCTFKQEVSLYEVKAHPTLKEIPLVRQSRLSVMPLDKKDFDELLKLGKTQLPAKV